MRIAELINQTEVVVEPFVSISSIETRLIQNEYLVVKDGNTFLGILTPNDVLVEGHNLVIDCCREKPLINENEDAEAVFTRMLVDNYSVLPVINNSDNYLGSVKITMIFKQVFDVAKQSIKINWINVVGDSDTEESKQRFSAELFHNTRNPVQAILSSVDILRSSRAKFESEVLLKSIESNARLLDTIISRLYAMHFETT